MDELIEIDDFAKEVSDAKKVQKIDNGIEAQKKVMKHSPEYWQNVLEYGQTKTGYYSQRRKYYWIFP